MPVSTFRPTLGDEEFFDRGDLTLPRASVSSSWPVDEYLQQNASATAGDPQNWTISFWFRPGHADRASYQVLTEAYYNSTNWTRIALETGTGKLYCFSNHAGSQAGGKIQRRLANDRWYHVVVMCDADYSGGGNSNTLRIWIDGIEEVLDYTGTWVAGDHYFSRGDSITIHLIMIDGGGTLYLNGIMFDYHHVDGKNYADGLRPTHFGRWNSYGKWVPKTADHGLSYGNRGAYMDFSDSADLGANRAATGGIDWTAGTMDANNWGYHNPMEPFEGSLLEPEMAHSGSHKNAAKKFEGNSTVHRRWGINAPVYKNTGKYYGELYLADTGGVNYVGVGVRNMNGTTTANGVDPGQSEADGFSLRNNTGTNLRHYHDATFTDLTDTGTFHTTGDYVGIAFDTDTGKYWFAINGTWLDSGDPAAGTNEIGTYDWSAGANTGADDDGESLGMCPSGNSYNFGDAFALQWRDRPEEFSGVVPDGFQPWMDRSKALMRTQHNPTDFVNRIGWDGNGTNPRTLTVEQDYAWQHTFTPDVVMIDNWGTTTESLLYTDTTEAIATGGHINGFVGGVVLDTTNVDGKVTGFVDGGFTVDAGSTSDNKVNDAAYHYGAWILNTDNWPGAGTFTYEGTGSNQTIAHGLGGTPHFVYCKNVDGTGASYAYNFCGKDTSEADQDGKGVRYNVESGTVQSADTLIWQNLNPTATNFYVGASTNSNNSGDTYHCLALADLPGVCKVFSHNGYGSVNGPAVMCGFRPAVIYIWITYGSGVACYHWNDAAMYVTDLSNQTTKRGLGVNSFEPRELRHDLGAAETANYLIDIQDYGFRLNASNSSTNTANGEYMGFALAALPEKWSR